MFPTSSHGCACAKSLNCARRVSQDCSSSSLLAHLYSYLLVLLHSFIVMSTNANKNGLQQQCDDKISEISTKGLKAQMGEQKRHKNTVICLWNNAVGIKVLQSGRRADVWTSVFSSESFSSNFHIEPGGFDLFFKIHFRLDKSIYQACTNVLLHNVNFHQ